MVMQQVKKSADAMKPNQSTLKYIKGKYYLLKKSLDLSLFRVCRSQNRVLEFCGFRGNWECMNVFIISSK